MQIEIVLTTAERGLAMEKVVAHDKITSRTNVKDFVTWHATRLLKGGFSLHRDDDNVLGWVAVNSRGDMLSIRLAIRTQATSNKERLQK
jgi:hypothetical protein